MLRFLIKSEALSLDGRSEWIRLGMALKASRGQAGFPLWNALSAEAEGYEPDKIEKEWQSFGKRSADEPSITIATYYARAKELGWTPPRAIGKKADAGTSSGGPSKNEDLAAFTVRLAVEAGDELWVDQEAKPHVTYVASLPDGSAAIQSNALMFHPNQIHFRKSRLWANP